MNEQELEEALAERGVRIVSPEKLSFDDQVRLFNEHHTFIGLLGSAFHSLLYALPGRALRTVVIGSARGSYPNYFMIDHLKGIEASYVYDQGAPGARPIPRWTQRRSARTRSCSRCSNRQSSPRSTNTPSCAISSA